jgi:XTP/dITP diphosphohydrolase
MNGGEGPPERSITREAPRLLLATNNPDKVREFRALLDGSGWAIVSPDDIGLELDVEETGGSFAENARIKATAFAHASGLPALADDSGLEVDPLGGEPGPLHHLRGWDGADDGERIEILLNRLRTVAPHRRTGRYRAVLTVVLPDGTEASAEGTCEGIITDPPRGSGGFGYDPVFLIPDMGQTMAELSFEEKNQVSHRARAAARLGPELRRLAHHL